MLKMLLAVSLAVSIARPAPIASVESQDKPDFSGRWILESVSQAAPDSPRALSVRQRLVRTNVRGEPMTPHFRDIAVDREFESGTQSETYTIGVSFGAISGRVGGGPAGPRRHQAVKWDGNALVFESGSYTGDARETGVWTERREVWSLDSDGRLRLTIASHGSAGTPSKVTLLYRRQ